MTLYLQAFDAVLLYLHPSSAAGELRGGSKELIPPFTGRDEAIEVLHIPRFCQLFWCCWSEGRTYIHELLF